MEKVALEAGMFDVGVEREQEYGALLLAGMKGFTDVVGHRYSDEEVFVLNTPATNLQTGSYEQLKESLQAQGYTLVPLLEWAAKQA